MAMNRLNEFAVALAVYARKKMDAINRGALLIRCVDDGHMIAAVFGNDNYRYDAKAHQEVALVRKQLREAGVEELGFGLSPDGYTWTLLVKTDHHDYQTEAGRAFQVEMLKVFLDEVVWRSWRKACGVSADQPERIVLSAE
jgi:hypothetical protein